ICLLTSAFLFIAFTSYLFTWQQDQDKVFQFGVKIFAINDVHVSNLLGVLGAYISHQFIYNGFGVSSYLFCTFFFVIGVNLLFAKKIFSLARNLRYMLVGLLVLSVAFAFFFGNSTFSFGGAVGELIEAWLVKWIGNVGTAASLGLAVFTYIIWRFNPVFKLPQRRVPRHSVATNGEVSDDIISNDIMHAEPFFVKGNAGFDKSEDIGSSNKLKKDSNGIAVIMPTNDEPEINPLHEFSLKEKYLPPEETNELRKEKPNDVDEFLLDVNEEEMQLEIKEVQEDDEESIQYPVSNYMPQSDYEPTLDLSIYQVPSLDLLETHGSEKIVHDPAELEANKHQIIATLKNYDI